MTISEITDQSIHQVIQIASDVIGNNIVSEEKNFIVKFEEMLTDSNKIDLMVFGDEVMSLFAPYQNYFKTIKKTNLKGYIKK